MSLFVIVLYIQCFLGSVNKIKSTNCSLLVKENEHQHRGGHDGGSGISVLFNVKPLEFYTLLDQTRQTIQHPAASVHSERPGGFCIHDDSMDFYQTRSHLTS